MVIALGVRYISLFSHICGCANNGQVYSFKDVKCVFVFVTKYGEIHGLVLRRRVQGFKRKDVRLLSSFETKVSVYKAHVLSLHDSSQRTTFNFYLHIQFVLNPFLSF